MISGSNVTNLRYQKRIQFHFKSVPCSLLIGPTTLDEKFGGIDFILFTTSYFKAEIETHVREIQQSVREKRAIRRSKDREREA